MSDLEARVAALERTIVALRRELRQSVAFGRTTQAPDDTGAVQTVQGRTDGMTVKDGMPVLMHYGFSSVMPSGGDKVVLFANGDRSSGVVIATGHQTYRIKGLSNGDVAMYDNRGQSIKLTAAGPVVDSAGHNLTIQNTPTVTADITLFRVQGDIIDHYQTNAHTSADMRSIYDSHTHPDPQDGDTDPPNQTM